MSLRISPDLELPLDISGETVGIDFDTHCVHCVLLPEEGHARYLPFRLEGQDAFERTRSVRDAMPSRSYWRDEGVIALGIEEPQGISKSTVAKLKAVQGAVLACLPSYLLVHPMVPARWRAEVGLPGNATKEDVFQYVRQDAPLYGYCEEWPQDAFDAYCLALAVQKLTEPVHE